MSEKPLCGCVLNAHHKVMHNYEIGIATVGGGGVVCPR